MSKLKSIKFYLVSIQAQSSVWDTKLTIQFLQQWIGGCTCVPDKSVIIISISIFPKNNSNGLIFKRTHNAGISNKASVDETINDLETFKLSGT